MVIVVFVWEKKTKFLLMHVDMIYVSWRDLGSSHLSNICRPFLLPVVIHTSCKVLTIE